MSNKVTKIKESLDKKLETNSEKGRRLVRDNQCSPYTDTDGVFKKIHSLFEEGRDGRKRKRVEREISKLAAKAINILNLDTKGLVISSISDMYRLFMVEMIDDLEREYDIKTSSEKALVQAAALSFVHYLSASNLLNINCPGEWITDSQFLSMLSKDADRAYRRFISSIQLLKHLKEPHLKVNVRANNAFMAQNQQINNKLQDEINTP